MNDKGWPPPFARVWPLAADGIEPTAVMRSQPEDFFVQELRDEAFSGSGEHLCLELEKRGQNTRWVAGQLAAGLGLKPRDVGYAGLKDRHAVTRQWFSLPLADETQLQGLAIEGVTLLQTARHHRKLRPGDLSGNAFVLRLRQLEGDRQLLLQRLQAVAAEGFANFFGQQRFGRNGDNVVQALDMYKRRRLARHNNRGIYLSAARSWLFNRFLADRIEAGEWPALAAMQQPTGPLWGRGRPPADVAFAEAEAQLPQRFAELVDLLEHSGLAQERRLLRLQPALSWQWHDDELLLEFALPAGSYATALLDQLLLTRAPDA